MDDEQRIAIINQHLLMRDLRGKTLQEQAAFVTEMMSPEMLGHHYAHEAWNQLLEEDKQEQHNLTQ